jgi:hypothetical protein
MTAAIRQFDTGATRDLDGSKLDYEACLSPLVLKRYAEYMHSHRVLADGSLRDGDNWQKGIPRAAYLKSGFRHFFDMWSEHRGIATPEGLELAACGLLFNVMGYLHEHLKAQAIAPESGVIAPENGAVIPPDSGAVGNHGVQNATFVDDDDNMGLKAGEAYLPNPVSQTTGD